MSCFLSSGQLITGSTGLIYKGSDGTGRIIKPDEYALKSEVEGVVGEMNDELVKYGKEKISEAITEKGVPTSTSDSFDKMAENIGAIKSEYNNGDLNIFCQTTQPTAQNGLWIKRNPSEIKNILIKDDYYLADGVAGDLPLVFKNNYYNSSHPYIHSTVYNNKLFLYYGSGSSNNFIKYMNIVDLKQLTVDTVTISTNYSSAIIINPSASFRYKNIFYMCTGQNYNMQLNLDDNSMQSGLSKALVPTGSNAKTILANCVINNILYTLQYTADSTNNSKITFTMVSADIDNATTTFNGTILNSISVTMTPFTHPYQMPTKMVEYDGKLYCFNGLKLILIYNINDNTFEILNSSVAPLGYLSDQVIIGIYYILGKVFFIGCTNSSVSGSVMSDICTYDIGANISTALPGILNSSDNKRTNDSGIYGFTYDNTDIYISGAAHDNSTSSYGEAVTKYTVASNNYENGTILCQPSANSNLTKMYSSDLITLNYGIDGVYYQAADGLHKQDAVIIKDGVITDI